VKTIFAVGLFARKTGKAAEVAEVLAKYVLKEVPNAAVVRQILDELFEGAATRLVEKYGDNILQDLIVVAENNGDLRKTLGVVKATSDGSVMWLEEGRLVSAKDATTWVEDVGGSGWIHMRNNRVINPNGNQFLRYGSKYADEEEIKALILEAARYGDKFVNSKGIWCKYEVPESGGKYLHVLVGSNGYLVTTIPGDTI
jgi:hypothetical protein